MDYVNNRTSIPPMTQTRERALRTRCSRPCAITNAALHVVRILLCATLPSMRLRVGSTQLTLSNHLFGSLTILNHALHSCFALHNFVCAAPAHVHAFPHSAPGLTTGDRA